MHVDPVSENMCDSCLTELKKKSFGSFTSDYIPTVTMLTKHIGPAVSGPRGWKLMDRIFITNLP